MNTTDRWEDASVAALLPPTSSALENRRRRWYQVRLSSFSLATLVIVLLCISFGINQQKQRLKVQYKKAVERAERATIVGETLKKGNQKLKRKSIAVRRINECTALHYLVAQSETEEKTKELDLLRVEFDELKARFVELEKRYDSFHWDYSAARMASDQSLQDQLDRAISEQALATFEKVHAMNELRHEREAKTPVAWRDLFIVDAEQLFSPEPESDNLDNEP